MGEREDEVYPGDSVILGARDRLLDSLRGETIAVALVAIQYAFASYVIHLRDRHPHRRDPSDTVAIMAAAVLGSIQDDDDCGLRMTAPIGRTLQ